ncbi:hypothetical protein HKX17_16855 [Sulfitobacter sp. KE34]|nr:MULTISPECIES: hypothetical protein [unclassified Sulfitobacter]MDF3359138.1 hypothetical protein [Sulfitobacter sp. KE33]MDF3370171.1 hypothetical protein [Sulfitobacter sp. Ks43]MDF3398598.1 hypothetical protein [Sulfitobacter sp. S32]MDF3351818.1 hypothetical protein [Sulfitobacter sp. KE12]MDF3377457.1 hypothetical protein [Sulfitobacter sp. KE37]
MKVTIPSSLQMLGDYVRVFADVNDQYFLPDDYSNADLIASPGGQSELTPVATGQFTLDGDLTDWSGLDPLYTAQDGTSLRGALSEGYAVFAINAPSEVGQSTTIWLDTDLDPATGYQIWGFAGGAEYNIEIAADGSAALFSGGAGETFVADLDVRYNADRTIAEVAVSLADTGITDAVRVLADVNNSVFLPGDYSAKNLVVYGAGQPLLPVATGQFTLDGDLTDWSGLDPLYTAQDGTSLRGALSEDYAVFAINAPSEVGQSTTIWLDTDLDPASGYQIWGFAGGAEYNIEIAADGSAALFSGGAGETFVADLDVRYNADHTIAEVAVSLADTGITDAVRVLADVNNSVFLPGDYLTTDLIAGDASPSVVLGPYIIDGILSEYSERTLLYATSDEAAKIFGDVVEEGAVIGLVAEVGIGAGTTIWLDTDLNRSTGHQIWGVTGGAEYNIEIAEDGTAGLYTGGAGEVFVTSLEIQYAEDGRSAEIALTRSDADFGNEIRLFSDINNSVFLPGDYANENLIAGTPDVLIGGADTRVGIVYSETTAANYFDITNYGQLIMSAQSQAMQAGIPFDLLDEAALTDAALLAQYDALIFPSFANVRADEVDDIAQSLELAANSGTGIIAAGNFMTNDETGAALSGNAYARMQSLLGVTLNGFGTTEGVEIVAGDALNPIMDEYTVGTLAGQYETLTSYLHFKDVTGSGEVLFDQVLTQDGLQHTEEAVIATQVGANRIVHFATDAVIGNSNILHEAIDWVAKDDLGTVDIGLQMSRNSSLFYSRNDMDQSQEYYDVAILEEGIYDLLVPMLADWKERYDFVGSYYVNVGANPPDQQTDWDISLPYYDAILSMGNEIGSHSYTHPEDTNLLESDTPELLELLARIDPRDPDSLNPWELSRSEQELLHNSFRFQFETSALELAQRLGIEITGAAVPGAPETLGTSLEIIQFYDYLSGGYSGTGAGYPGAFGYLTPNQEAVYLAPNMSFDFSLIDFQNLTPEEAEAVWDKELKDITTNANTPIIAFPWHDYGPTEWAFGEEASSYTYEMFDNFLAAAHASGTEFVTGKDLAERIATFEASELTLARTGDIITAQVVSGNAAGRFALEVGEQISGVSDWYAWDGTQVFLPRGGGKFDISVGSAVEEVTRITALPNRSELVSLSGDGRNLLAELNGAGDLSLHLGPDWGAENVMIRGGLTARHVTEDGLELVLGNGLNLISVDYVPGSTPGTAANEVMMGGTADDTLVSHGGADVMMGGAGNDVFVVQMESASTKVLDFDPLAEVLIFDWQADTAGSPWACEDEVLNGFSDYEAGTRLVLEDGYLVDLVGLTRAQLDTENFQFNDSTWVL